jgi:hypothetical protein
MLVRSDSGSPYIITPFEDGFRVERKQLFLPFGDHDPRVTVRLEPWALRVSGVLPGECRLGLFAGHALVQVVAIRLARSWQPPPGRKGFPGAVMWVARQIGRGLARAVGAERRRLLAKVPRQVADVQRRIFASTFGSAWLAETESFYEQPYLAHDVVRHRAAAVAVAHVDNLVLGPALRNDCPSVAGPTGGESFALSALADWPALFSVTGRPYRSLNRTLMNLPRVLPSDILCLLARVRLVRPVTHRVGLVALCARAQLTAPRPTVIDDNQIRILQHATADQIRRAIVRVGAHTRRTLNPRRAEDVSSAMRFLADFPELHGGGLQGLVDKAIRWHRRAGANGWLDGLDVFSEPVGPETRTALPPIPLPDIAGIRFLGSVGDLIEESRRMRHCIAVYAQRAVRGECYLFHVDRGGEQASVEVAADGSVRQAHGPGNVRNAAVAWGTRRLAVWAEGLREPVAA